MRFHRLALALAVASLLLGGFLFPAPRARAVGRWTPAAPMSTARVGHTATLLPNGQVLVIGNATFDNPRMTAERYDPATDTWTPAASPTITHYAHTATPLPDGQVLLVGQTTENGPDNTAERYDPATDRWTPTGPKATLAMGTATPLANGQVLVAGGVTYSGPKEVAERYDPATNGWTPAAKMTTARYNGQAAVRLADGRVLVLGGYGPPCTKTCRWLDSAERYDPTTDTWTPAGTMTTTGGRVSATLLPDGQVLALPNDAVGRPPAAERYDPGANRWTPATPPATIRAGYTATLLPTGRVLVAGGGDGHGNILASTELYDPERDRWAADTPLDTPRGGHTATLLPDGRVLVTGGGTSQDQSATAELYDATPAPRACFPETGQCVDGLFFAYWEQNGGLARNGYPLSDVRVERLEDGRAYQVQYFERVRLEWHPENQPPYDVLLGQFGRRVLLARTGRDAAPPAQPLDGQVYFPETGHNVGDGFLRYWQDNGGLAQFGYPLTEVFEEQLEDGNRYQVQYFERARFEYHPENAAPFDILLGQFGRQILAEADGRR